MLWTLHEQMKFKTDENLPEEIALLLREATFDAMSVREEELGGENDEDLAEICRREGRNLITLDNDFSDMRKYPPNQYPGFIVLRVHRQNKKAIIGLFRRILPALQIEVLEHVLWIVEEHRIRIRGEE